MIILASLCRVIELVNCFDGYYVMVTAIVTTTTTTTTMMLVMITVLRSDGDSKRRVAVTSRPTSAESESASFMEQLIQIRDQCKCDIRDRRCQRDWIEHRWTLKISRMDEWEGECTSVGENEWVSEWVNEWKWLNEWVSESVNEWKWLSEWVSESVNEWKWMSEWISERVKVIEQMSEWVKVKSSMSDRTKFHAPTTWITSAISSQ